ncbi:phage holin family protein [Oceanobacillus massiliensis]|uniref:phage holin family protein n=1 Tax=Oceanobacillus massiliensis TaxID=1465765 RepID=UPI000288B582|nr:phage holin family protein [Oceanobacillus massiliensis]
MLARWMITLFLNAIALIAVAQLFESFYIEGFGTALLASIILGILNVLVKPFLILLTLPITIMTLGLFLIVINAITLMMTQSLFGPAFAIDGFGMAILAAILISVINMLLNSLIKDSLK